MQERIEKKIGEIKVIWEGKNDKLSQKVVKKYQYLLKCKIQSLKNDCRILVFEIVQREEKEIFENKGIQLFQDSLNQLFAQHSREKLRKDDNLVLLKFNELWNYKLTQVKQYYEGVFRIYQENIYLTLSCALLQYCLKSENDQNLLSFFETQLNKNNPDLVQNEKWKVFEKYQLEIDQDEQQFEVISLHTQQRYIEIYASPFEKKISSSEQDIIRLSEFYFYKITWKFVEKVKLVQYFKNKLLFDFKNNFIEKRNKITNSQIEQFFSIFKKFKVGYNEQKFCEFMAAAIQIIEITYKNATEKFSQIEGLFMNLSKTFVFDDISFQFSNQTISEKLYPQMEVKVLDQTFETFEEMKQKRIEIQKSNILIIEILLINPKKGDYSLYFGFIQSAEKQNQEQFSLTFPQEFNQLMEKKQLWREIYFKIYDYIKEKLTRDDDSSYRPELFTEIMSNIEQQLIKYNEQFSKFGLVLKDIGMRRIFQFSIYIIWRISCYKRWKIFQEKINDISFESLNYQLQFQQFRAEIQENKQEISENRVRQLIEEIKDQYLKKQIEIENSNLKLEISGKTKRNVDFVKQLDSQLLSITKVSPQNIKEQSIKYIQDQKEFINVEVDKYSDQIKQEILEKVLNRIQKHFQNEVQILLDNIEFFLDKKFYVQTNYFFQNPINDEFCHSKLFDIIISYLFGKQNKMQDINLLKEYYQTEFKSGRFLMCGISYCKGLNKQDYQIVSLEYFIQYLKEQLRDILSQIVQNKEIFKLNELDLESQLDKLRLEIKGCQESCPMCNRKCDLPRHNNQQQQHMCQNGHYLRGMKGILIKDKPSLFTCEEIEQETTILIKQNKFEQEQKWKEIIKKYPEWNFQNLKQNTKEFEDHKAKITNTWNSGVGYVICEFLRNKYHIQVQFDLKCEDQVRQMVHFQPVHYIFMLDDSGSMEGEKWNNSKVAALQVINSLQNNPQAFVSVIIFNDKARLVLDCKKANLENQHQLIQYEGNGTDFENAFKLALDQIEKYETKQLSTFILFYTDGEASCPTLSIKRFINLQEQTRKQITMIISTETSDPKELQEVEKSLKDHLRRVELLTCLQTNSIKEVWSEIVHQSIHNLR